MHLLNCVASDFYGGEAVLNQLEFKCPLRSHLQGRFCPRSVCAGGDRSSTLTQLSSGLEALISELLFQNHPRLFQNPSILFQNHPRLFQNHPSLFQNHPTLSQNHLGVFSLLLWWFIEGAGGDPADGLAEDWEHLRRFGQSDAAKSTSSATTRGFLPVSLYLPVSFSACLSLPVSICLSLSLYN